MDEWTVGWVRGVRWRFFLFEYKMGGVSLEKSAMEIEDRASQLLVR